jgi:hypothetical protein
LIHAADILEGSIGKDLAEFVGKAEAEGSARHFFHWPLAFPEVFHPSSERNPGFDAVIGNPPWDEVTVEELGFYALHDPGLRGMTSEAGRRQRIAELREKYPQLEQEFESRKKEAEVQRAFFRPENGYAIQGAGDLDLYELFCERYQTLTRDGGRAAVVQPRSTFLAVGSRGFRRWLFGACTVERLDFILNNRSWAFPIHPQYTIALVSFRVSPPVKGSALVVSGPASSLKDFQENTMLPGVRIALDDLASWTPSPAGDPSSKPSWEVPLLPSDDFARVFAKVRSGPRFDTWADKHGKVFAVRELDETNQSRYFKHKAGAPVWKGRCFDQYDPHGREPAGYGDFDEVLQFVHSKRQSSRSSFAGKVPAEVLRDPSTHPIHHARIAFRDVSRATDSRTVRACLIPPKTPLTNSAPYLVFPNGDAKLTAQLLGVMNSIPFDWQARRFVETHLNFYVLDLLCLPEAGEELLTAISTRAARLSCIDDRFNEFAAQSGVTCGALKREERGGLRAEIDALVAKAYGLSHDDLQITFSDFTRDAVSPEDRALVLQKFDEMQ